MFDRVDVLEQRLAWLEEARRDRWDDQKRLEERVLRAVKSELLFTGFKVFAVLQIVVAVGLLIWRR